MVTKAELLHRVLNFRLIDQQVRLLKVFLNKVGDIKEQINPLAAKLKLLDGEK